MNFTSENVMTLDWIDGVSIRETEQLKHKNIDTNKKTFNTSKVVSIVITNPQLVNKTFK